MQLLSWELITEGPDERTERIPAPGGGWLYRTTVFVSRLDGEKPRYIAAAVDLIVVPAAIAESPERARTSRPTPDKLNSQA
jgi:hypothetical protein